MTALARAAGVATSAIIRSFGQAYDWARENPWAVLKVIIVLVVLALLLRPGLLLLGLLGHNLLGLFQAEARIYVEPPQVYTRERLVNDRFRETNWLENRLKNLGTVSDDGPSSYSVVDDNRLVVAGDTTDGQRQQGETQPPSPPPLLSIDKIDAFNLDFERRVAVRSEMLNTLLDDGHDLSGSTLYRMNFDVSVVPRPGAQGFGLVAIDAQPYGCEAGPAFEKKCYSLEPDARLEERIVSYRRLLGSWEQDLQQFLSKVYRDRTALSGTSLGYDPFAGSPKERMAFNAYVKVKAVEYWIGLVAGPNDTDCTEPFENEVSKKKCEEWYNNMNARVAYVRQALRIPGTATLLPSELPDKLEHAFTREIKRHSDAIADRIKRRELERFIGDLDNALAACPARADNEMGCATCREPGEEQTTNSRLPECKSTEDTKSEDGEGGSGPGNSKPPNTGLFVVAGPGYAPLGNLEGQPAKSKTTAENSTNSKEDSSTKIRPDHRAKILQRSTVLRLSGLPDMSNICLEQSANNTETCTKSDGNLIELRRLYSAVVDSAACSSGRPFFLPWSPNGHQVLCPADLPDHVMNMYGLVRLASLVRDMHETLIANPNDGGKFNGVASSLHLPHGASADDVRDRSKALYACFSKGRCDKTCAGLCMSPSTDCQIATRRFEHGLGCGDETSNKACEEIGEVVPKECQSYDGQPNSRKLITHPEPQDSDLSLFKSWFSEFFVDRLSRTDIPGYQPSPPVERFFDVRQVGCETGACDILVNRKRWLSKENWLEVGQNIEISLNRYPDKRKRHSRRGPPLEAWLPILLPNTNRYCVDKSELDCFAVVRAALKAAKHLTADRPVIKSTDVSIGQNQFEERFDSAYRCLKYEHTMDCDENEVSPTPISNIVRYVAWDFAQSIVALSLEQRLEQLGGDVSVYAIEPRTRSIVELSAAKQSLRLAASLQALPKVAGTGFEYLKAAQEVAQRLERIGAQPSLVGFGHLRGDADDSYRQGGASFGWMFLPNHLESKGIFGAEIATHKPETYRLAAVLSVPSWWPGLHFTVRQCWGRPGMFAASIISDPYQADEQCDGKHYRPGLAPAGRTTYSVELPASTERITEVFDFEVTKIPYIDHRETGGAQLEAGRAGKVVIEGGRLWRGTMVTLQEQQADEITVLPDMKGVVASFKCVEPIAGQLQFTDYATLKNGSGPTGTPVHDKQNARLTVWTAQGNAFTAVSIWPFKQRVEGEQPCWEQKRTFSGRQNGPSAAGRSPAGELSHTITVVSRDAQESVEE